MTSDEPTPPSPPQAPREADRSRRPRIVAAGLAAGVLLVALVVIVATNGDGDDDHAGRGTTTPEDSASGGDDEPATTTTGSADRTTTSVPGPAGGGAFADGRWTVGEDIRPGRYIAGEIQGDSCDWTRLSDASDDAVIAGETGVANQAVVDVLGSDAAFRSSGCGRWVPYTAPDPPPLTTIDQGDWVVGEQIEPGAYRVPQGPSCSWTRATGFEHIPREVTQTERTNIALEGPYLVTLTAGERFTTRGCDTWTKAD